MDKFIYVGDLHLRTTKPTSRIDDYCETMFSLLSWIVEYANNIKAKAIVFGGDIGHIADWPVSLVNRASNTLNLFKGPCISVIGNHDMVLYNLETYKNMGLGALEKTGSIIIPPENKSLEIGNFQFYFFHCETNTSKKLLSNTYTLPFINPNKVVVGVCHAPVGSHNKYGQIDVKSLKIDCCDIICFADIHESFPPTKIGKNTIAVNVGSVERSNKNEIDKQTYIGVISDDKSIEYIPLPIKPAIEVFNPALFNKISETDKKIIESVNEVKERIKALESAKQEDVIEVVLSICEDCNTTEEVKVLLKEVLND